MARMGVSAPRMQELSKYAVNRPGMEEDIFQPLYDYQTYALAGTTSEYQFFQVPQGQGGKTLADTNMDSAGQLPAPKRALVTQVQGLWIESVTALLSDIYYAAVSAERIGQRDLLETIQNLSRTVSHAALLRTIEGIRKLKGQLSYNVNRQIALEALFVDLTRSTN